MIAQPRSHALKESKPAVPQTPTRYQGKRLTFSKSQAISKDWERSNRFSQEIYHSDQGSLLNQKENILEDHPMDSSLHPDTHMFNDQESQGERGRKPRHQTAWEEQEPSKDSAFENSIDCQIPDLQQVTSSQGATAEDLKKSL